MYCIIFMKEATYDVTFYEVSVLKSSPCGRKISVEAYKGMSGLVGPIANKYFARTVRVIFNLFPINRHCL